MQESKTREEEASSRKDRQAHGRQAKQDFRQALGYAVAGSHPLVLAVVDGVASGTSTLARALGEELGWRRFTSDTMRKELAQCVVSDARLEDYEKLAARDARPE